MTKKITTTINEDNILITKNPSGIFLFIESEIAMSYSLDSRNPASYSRWSNRSRTRFGSLLKAFAVPYDYYYSSKSGKLVKRDHKENNFFVPSTKNYPGKQKLFYLFIPPEYMIQLPTYSKLTKEHLKIVPNLWTWGPKLANKLLSKQELFDKGPGSCYKGITWETASWYREAEHFNSYRRDCIKYFGWKNSKEFDDAGGFDISKFPLNEKGYIDHLFCGGRNNNSKVIGKVLAERTNAELEVLKYINEVIDDLTNIKTKVMNGEPIKNKALPQSFTKFGRRYSKNVKKLVYGRDIVERLTIDPITTPSSTIEKTSTEEE